MDIRKVKKLIELLEESKVSEIEIHEGEESVRISRNSSGVAQAIMHVPGTPESAQPAIPAVTPSKDGLPVIETGHIVKSPMVGTYYSSATPGSPPFVDVGQPVSEGDVLCIIEAMKIMNQIEADVSGVISKVLVSNGDPVEYGQSLFIIT